MQSPTAASKETGQDSAEPKAWIGLFDAIIGLFKLFGRWPMAETALKMNRPARDASDALQAAKKIAQQSRVVIVLALILTLLALNLMSSQKLVSPLPGGLKWQHLTLAQTEHVFERFASLASFFKCQDEHATVLIVVLPRWNSQNIASKSCEPVCKRETCQTFLSAMTYSCSKLKGWQRMQKSLSVVFRARQEHCIDSFPSLQQRVIPARRGWVGLVPKKDFVTKDLPWSRQCLMYTMPGRKCLLLRQLMTSESKFWSGQGILYCIFAVSVLKLAGRDYSSRTFGRCWASRDLADSCWLLFSRT